MKTKTNFVVFAILSLLVGTAFASPLLFSELEVVPYREPLPKSPSADVSATVVYANFSVGELSTTFDNLTAWDVSYFVVLNITNNSDDAVFVRELRYSAAENITKGVANSFFFSSTSKFSVGWTAKGAWVDGKWYNLTYVSYDWMDPSLMGNYTVPASYWMEGVQIKDTYVGQELNTTYINMNGTYVDVTGRIEVEGRPDTPFNDVLTVTREYFGEMKILVDGSSSDPGYFAGITTFAPQEFDNIWAPHQSRLIVIQNSRQILASCINETRLEYMATQPISMRLTVFHNVHGTLGISDSSGSSEEIKQVQMQLIDNVYEYNVILADNQMFVTDELGMDAFIEPRN